MNETQTNIQLPNDVISPTDIYRLIREIEMLDDFFRQAEIRSGGTPQSPPRYSRLLDSVVTRNSINLLEEHQRDELLQSLQYSSEHSPVLHMSFSVDPPGAYVQKIVAWLRENLQADILLRVGLQPNIGAGCVVRTTNHAYDFSLRKYFDSKREYFGQKLHDAVAAQDKHYDEGLDPGILPTHESDDYRTSSGVQSPTSEAGQSESQQVQDGAGTAQENTTEQTDETQVVQNSADNTQNNENQSVNTEQQQAGTS